MCRGLGVQPTLPVMARQPPLLLDWVAQAARQRGKSQSTRARLLSAVRAFILLQGKRCPLDLGPLDTTRLLERVVRTGSRPLPAQKMHGRPPDCLTGRSWASTWANCLGSRRVDC